MKLNKQWIRFANRGDWLATKHSKLCEFYFEEKYLWRSEECIVVEEFGTHRLSSKMFK